MLKQKRLCNGESTGFQCKHYWAFRTLLDVDNPDHLRKGENARRCLVQLGEFFEMGDGGSEMAVYCNRFEPSERPHDPEFESFKPMTPEEIRRLEVEYVATHGASEVQVRQDVPGLDDLQAALIAKRRAAALDAGAGAADEPGGVLGGSIFDETADESSDDD